LVELEVEYSVEEAEKLQPEQYGDVLYIVGSFSGKILRAWVNAKSLTGVEALRKIDRAIQHHRGMGKHDRSLHRSMTLISEILRREVIPEVQRWERGNLSTEAGKA
jgi:hypothetical protein